MNTASERLSTSHTWKMAVKKFLRPYVRKIGLDFTYLGGEESEKPHPTNPEGYTVTQRELELLRRLVQQSSEYPGPIIEIGTLFGISATRMALVKQPHQKIITVDNFCWNPWKLSPERHYLLATYMLQYLIETGHVELVRMDKNEFYQSYQGPAPSLVFLDAWHTYEETKKDIDWAKRVGAKIIAGHDYHEGVKQIVDEYGGPAELVGGLWLLNPEFTAS